MFTIHAMVGKRRNQINMPRLDAYVFRANGTTVADWARERGFSVELTRMVLAGKRKCLRGQSHNIAVALRIKAGATDQSIA